MEVLPLLLHSNETVRFKQKIILPYVTFGLQKAFYSNDRIELEQQVKPAQCLH